MKLIKPALFGYCFVYLGNVHRLGSNQKKQERYDGVKLIQDIEYAKHDGVGLKLDLYVPKEIKGSVPVIVFVHGEAGRTASKSSGKRGAWIVPHGFAIASISYRLTDVGQWRIESTIAMQQFVGCENTQVNMGSMENALVVGERLQVLI